MAKKICCICLLAFWVVPQVTFAQPDTATTILADSARVNERLQSQPGAKVKTWPIATTVALILISSYLLYNVRSR